MVVSVLPQAYVVDRVSGGTADVAVMIPPGGSPATYEPTIEQLRAVSEATLYVKIGHPNFAWERAWLDRLIEANPGLVVIDGSEGCRREVDDPHVWLSPVCVRSMASQVARALAEALPAAAERIRTELAAFEAEVEELDAEIRDRLAPYRGETFLVFHPAWGHFAADYGLRQVAIQRGAVEPGTHELGELIERARAEGIRVVFVQPQFPRTNAELVAREIGGTVVALDPLAGDWPASLRQAAAAFEEAFRR